MAVNGDDAGEQLSLGNHRGCFTSIDQFAKDCGGWVPQFDSSSTVHGDIPVHVKLRHGQNEGKLIVLWNRTGGRTSDEFGDGLRNRNSAVARAI